MALPRLAVVGHVEHITLGRVARLPAPGEIAHVEGITHFPGGGGGLALFQMLLGGGEVHAFTALGHDEAAVLVRDQVLARGALLHAAARESAHTRDVVLLTPEGERTILVLGAPLHPCAADPLPWQLLRDCDGVYFTAEDPAALQLARMARCLVVTARRRAALEASGVTADVVVGSAGDPRERCTRADLSRPPAAVVLTEGAQGGTIETASGRSRFAAPQVVAPIRCSYGAGDSFAGALTAYLAFGLDLTEACTRAAHHGAAVLTAEAPLQGQAPLDFSPAPSGA